ncbi:Tyrosine recombinase XerC [subsurface metagenome]
MTSTPKTLNVTECHRLLDALLVKDGTEKQFRKGMRNYTMALLMLDAGLRVGEVVRLAQNDLFYLDEPVRTLRLREEITKGKTERIVPLSSRICQTIREMYKYWWKNDIGGDWEYAFYRTDPEKQITTRQVERIIRTAAMKSIGRPVHPHVLRHTFATRLMRVTNERVVQELLGHKHIGSTQIYTHPNEDDKSEAIQKIQQVNTEQEAPGVTKYSPAGVPNRLDAPGTNGDV